ncbi:MAG: ribosome biogenesis GTPase YlqF [Clostridiales bacterium]|nr:ribosome biogenesis GTPase YlqF [Clostridiales bacterium]
MKINWFPGHMRKALKDISEQLKKVDVVTYILDSRIPLSSLNPTLSQLTENKPILYVFNKIDMADKNKLDAILPRFKSEKTDYILFNSTLSGKSNLITNKIKSLVSSKIKKYQSKGIKPTIRTMVVGVPNCGKSTLVNNLCKKAKAITGDKAGVTKRGLWLPIGDCIEVYDTPGTLYPNLADQEVAKKLAFVGSIRDEILDFVELAQELLMFLGKTYPQTINTRYNGEKTLEGIANLRKFVLSGGELDIERTARSVLDDFRKGRLGKLTLD